MSNKNTLNAIREYISKRESSNFNLTTLGYGDFGVTVKTSLTTKEKREFIKTVVSDIYKGGITFPSQIDVDVAFNANFIRMLTDLQLPELISNGEISDIAAELDIVNSARIQSEGANVLISELKDAIEHEVKFENQKLLKLYENNASEEAIGDFSFAMRKLAELFEKVTDVVVDNGDKIGSKLLELINEEGLSDIIGKLSKLNEQ